MKKIVFIISAVFVIGGQTMAQTYSTQVFDVSIGKNFHYGDYDHNEIDMTGYDKDPSAHALVLKEFGRATISSNGNNTPLTFEYHVKIKIFDSEGLSKAHVELPFYIQDNGSYEEIRLASIKGITYNDGVNESVLNPDSIHTVKVNKHWSKIVFNMPGVRKGSVIEYTYIFESPYLEKFKTWEFQSDIPKIYSEYEVHIPKVFGYNVSLRGSLKLSTDSVTTEKGCFESTDLNSDCTVEDYKMTDIPAFKEEAYINSPKNYLSALYFQLTEYTKLNNYTNLNQAWQQSVGGSWDDVDKLLNDNDNFGGQLNHKSILKSHFAPVIAGKTDTLDKAKAIYAYLQKNIVFDNLFNIYSDEGIKKAFDKHSGNSADINLALVAALNDEGIQADAVLISTRDNGVVNKLYPALSELNDVIAAASIGGKAYLLDATDPLMPFGMLPLRDLNDQGRVVSMNKPSYWINIVTPQKKTDTYSFDLSIDDNGKLKGTITHYAIGYAGYEKRKEIKSFKTIGDYVQNLSKSLPGVTITRSVISNPDSVDMPLSEVYEVEIDNQQNTFDPIIFDKLAGNPFTTTTRNYPIDFGMPQASSFTLTLHLPGNYAIASRLQNLSATLPGNGGELAASFENNGNTATYNVVYHLDKPIYNAGEYAVLKDFFDKIISAENAKIAFTKK